MLVFAFLFFFLFKQKTAYEMRISDWSSDVCSSDLLAAHGEGPQRGAADHDRLGAEGDGLHDVAAAADAAVHDDLDPVADRVGDEREGPDGGRGGVEVVATVVRDADGAVAGVDRAPRVVDAHDALEHERTVPLLAQPAQVVPARRGRAHPLAAGLEEAGGASPSGTMLGTWRSGRGRC